MFAALTALGISLGVAAPPIDTRFAQVAPSAREATAFARTPGRHRAVILLRGLSLHAFSKVGIVRAAFTEWQQEGSLLVRELGRDADVYSFAYAQTAAADEVADAPDLADCVRRVRALGYHEVVLVGYSAGGVIARQFVEDEPDAGVTKVIQVCSPNGGSGWASLPALCKQQAEFLRSLTKSNRRRALGARSGRQLPPNVEFVCVVGTGTVIGDGLVTTHSQWTDELQRQGVPAVEVGATHWHILRGKKGVEMVATLVREAQPRWDAAKVAAARRRIFGWP